MFALDKILTRIQGQGNSQFPLNEACFLMVIQHLLEPQSKLGTYHQQNHYFNLPPVELHHLYHYKEKAQLLLQNQSKITASNKRGGKKYLKNTSQETWYLDEEALIRDEQFDGYYAIETSEQDINPQATLIAYHTLWKIEESFRIMKSTLEVRPIFHWTEKRIKGHFVICFLAFLLERTLEFKLKEAQEEASPQAIREALNSLNFAEVEIENQQFLLKVKGTELSNKILKLLKIKPPKNITTKEELSL